MFFTKENTPPLRNSYGPTTTIVDNDHALLHRLLERVEALEELTTKPRKISEKRPPKYKHFTQAEDDFIKDNYKKFRPHALAEMMGITKSRLSSRAFLLGCAPSRKK